MVRSLRLVSLVLAAASVAVAAPSPKPKVAGSPKPRVAASAKPKVAASPAAVAATPETIERGRAVYERMSCDGCHSTTGPDPLPLRGLAKKYDVAKLEAFLKAPTPPMPKPNIGAADRRAVAEFMLADPTMR